MTISPDQYISALEELLTIKSKKIQNGFIMLKANYRAENMTISTTRLAKAAGYDSYETGNEQYGSFAHKISEIIGVERKENRDGTPIWSYIICDDNGIKDRHGHFQWTLKPDVAKAMEMMKLVSPVSRSNLLKEIEEKKEELSRIPEKTREAVINARIGQGIFRERLIKHWEGCSVTGFENTNFLIASHIKPWKDCSPGEALDVTNGLLLLPNIDCAFDKGFISFDKNGSVLLSPQLSVLDKKELGLLEGMKLRWCYPQHDAFLEYHRNHILKKEK